MESGLDKFVDTYHASGIRSIAFPILGSSNGGIPEEESLSIMQRYLSRVHIPVEIYRYDPAATDDLYEEFRKRLLALAGTDESVETLAQDMDVRVQYLRKVMGTLQNDDRINSLSQLATVKGIGGKTLEKCFRYIIDNPEGVKVLSLHQDRLL